jgi:hypothetical protein
MVGEAHMPTDVEIRAYADRLPAIYRTVLSAFPRVSPKRRVGDGLSADTILEFIEEESEYRADDAGDALRRLIAGGFLTESRNILIAPTPLGEQLIVAVSGHAPVPEGIPELPVPTWG